MFVVFVGVNCVNRYINQTPCAISRKPMTDIIRLEEFTGLVQNGKLVLVWTLGDATATATAWLPTEFMLSQYITRILVAGRTSATSLLLSSDPSWTQVWRSPGAKEWSCLFGILPHMPGPVLVVVGPDIVLSPKIVAGLRESSASISIVLRSPTIQDPWSSAFGTPDHTFFPVLGASGTFVPHAQAQLHTIIHEWNPRLDLKSLLPQLAISGYGLTMDSSGTWQWFKPSDSPPLTCLTPTQISRQIQILGTLVEGLSGGHTR